MWGCPVSYTGGRVNPGPLLKFIHHKLSDTQRKGPGVVKVGGPEAALLFITASCEAVNVVPAKDLLGFKWTCLCP